MSESSLLGGLVVSCLLPCDLAALKQAHLAFTGRVVDSKQASIPGASVTTHERSHRRVADTDDD